MYLSFALKIAFSNFFYWERSFWASVGLAFSLICLVALNTELVFLEALKKWFCAFKPPNDSFLAKSSNSWKSVFCHAKKLFISLERKIFHVLSFALKIAFSNFFSLRKKFWASGASAFSWFGSVATNTELVFLEALKKWFCAIKLSKCLFPAKKLKLMKSVLLHCKKLFISLERHIFHVLEFALKMHLATFSHWDKQFWASVASILIICLVA